jgi:amino acid adenylation domain-containing protein
VSAVHPDSIAVVGMAGRLPGARNIAEFWASLRAGTESITFFGEEELRAAGVPDRELADPQYVRAAAVPAGYEMFDAGFFGYSAREAALIDPQQRMFLECCWEALEDAGHRPGDAGLPTGVYAGSSLSTYLLAHLLAGRTIGSAADTLNLLVTNDKDYLASRVAYQLDLQGPAVAVQTACSSSLVAVHLACQALLGGECDLALAGGSALRLPQPRGYRWEEGLIFSPDGHCRPFDASAGGTVFGSGAGVVVLRRLADALDDGDHIEAVIRGSAANNDGRSKIGYTAPGIGGQTAVIAAALGAADVEPDTVTAIEAHGTATPLGDPIEIAALSRVFRAYTSRTGYCAIGSVKGNVGHLDTASGVTGLIKAILQVKHGQLVPSLHYERPNPEIDFAASPFTVSTELRDWQPDEGPRRIGVSSFGMGGTNAHLILEEPPAAGPAGAAAHPVQVLAMSARSTAALDAAGAALGGALAGDGPAGAPPPALADAAHTLRVGRADFARRRAVIARSAGAASAALAGGAEPGQTPAGEAGVVVTGHVRGQGQPRLVWLFPGQGSQYPGLGSQLHSAEPAYARCVDECLDLLPAEPGGQLRDLLLKPDAGRGAAERLQRTELAQPALFITGYALARLLRSWGVTPQAMLGHSIGEYVAACVSGVMDLPDALRLVTARGRLMQAMPPGDMLAVSLAEDELAPRLPADVSIAAVNAPELTVAGGPAEAIGELARRLRADGIGSRVLHTSHAFHTAMMEPMLAEFAAEFSGITLREPGIPYLSDVTGDWITPGQAADPRYWAAHAREPVRFGAAMATLEQWAGRDGLACAELGPGRVMRTLARTSVPGAAAASLLPGGAGRDGEHDEQVTVLTALAQLWTCGADIDLAAAGGAGRRISLPTYPFQRRRYWLDRDPAPGTGTADSAALADAVPADPQDDADAGEAVDERPPLETPYLAPRTDTEAQVAAIWTELLGVGPIGVHDNFIELGGHSLLATRMVELVRARAGVRLPLRRVLSSPTVAGLAELIAEISGGQEGDDLPRAVADPAAQHEPFPLTEIQQAQWLGRLGSFAGGNIAAHVYWEIDAADLDLGRLEQAWRSVMDRHPMLRAVLTGDGRQRILPDTPAYRIEVTDLREAGEADAAARLAELRERLSHEVRPADAWPLFEIRAARLRGGVTRVFLSFDLLIADIGSVRRLMHDWSRYYAGAGESLPPLRVGFRDYVIAQERLRETGLYAAALDYWRQRLDGLPPRPDLPLAVSPAAVTEPEFTARNLVIDRARWQRLRDRAGRRGLTVSAAVLAAYGATLGAWSRAGRFSLNVTVINRLPLHEDVGQLVGEFASFDLLPVDLTAADGFAALAAGLQEQSWQDLEHRYVNGVELLRQLARGQGGTPGAVMPFVFTSTLAQDGERDGESMFGWLGDVAHEIAQTPQVWIDCALLDVADGVQVSWHAVRQLFPDGVLDQMFAAFAGLVGRLADDDDVWSAALPALVPPSHAEAVAAANATAGPRPGGLLHDPVIARALADPDKLAVAGPDEELTYGDLHRRACDVARSLRAAGVEGGDLVAVSVPKSCAQVTAALAVLLAGGAYLPVDPDLPAERQDQLIAQSRAAAVLIAPGGRASWPDGIPAVTVDLASAPPQEPDLPPAGRAPRDLAYVIFTSGSTGQPKGVMISHQAALNTVDDITGRYGVGPGDRVLGLSSLSFDLSVYDIFGVLGAGGTLVLPRQGSSRDPGHWIEMIGRHRVTLWNSVPALAQMLADHALGEQLAGDGGAPAGPAGGHPGLASLRLMLLSGDWIPLDLPDRLRSVAPGARPVSLGGATEAAIWSIAYDIGAVDPAWESIPYGTPLRNQSFHVLSDRMRETPPWVTGDLYIGGIGLAEGYWDDPERTAASFITHPETGERLYRTGDLGRWRPEGFIEFLGREDAQVKVGGFRIELGEIDTVLSRLPGVAAGIAAAHGDRHHRRLAGYLVPAEGADRTPEADQALADLAREAAAASLPAYMVPGTFTVIGELPLSRNGKVDRAALPDPAAAAASGGDGGPVATRLAELITEVVGIPAAGPADNFFALGGDSITGVQVISRASAEGLPVTEADLFGLPTIGELAALAASRMDDDAARPAALQPTPAQQARAAAGDDALRAARCALLIPPPGLTPADAAAAIGELIRQHPALRQRWQAGGPSVAPAGDEPAYLPVIPLGGLPPERREPAMRQMIGEICAELDPAAGPAVTAALFDLGDGQRRLCVAALELCCDGRSWPALLDAMTCGPAAADEPGAADENEAAAALLDAARQRYRLAAHEVLVAVTAAALQELGGRDPVRLAVDYDLRDVLAGGPVGPFSAPGTVTVALPADPAALITGIKEACRAAAPSGEPPDISGPPDPSGPADAGGEAAAELTVRYLGELRGGVGLDGPPARRPDPDIGPVEVTGWRSGATIGLAVTGAACAEQRDALARALRAACGRLLEHCRAPGTGSLSTSDFPLADLSQDELAAFLAEAGAAPALTAGGEPGGRSDMEES